MKSLNLFVLIGISSLLFGFSQYALARHAYLLDETMPEAVDDSEEEMINEKFRPEELEAFLKTFKQDEVTKLGPLEVEQPPNFAEVSPDVLLERLIDEADQERNVETTAGKQEMDHNVMEKQDYMLQNDQVGTSSIDIDSDLNDSL